MYKENISGRIAFISGASSGIGEATAKMLASNNVNIILSARRVDKLQKLKNMLEDEYKVKILILEIDFANMENIKNSINSLDKQWQNIDILINNAGLALGKELYINNSIEDSLQMIRVNCEGAIVLTRLLLPYLINSKNAHIVNLSSVAADEGYSGGAIYCSTKAFINMFGDALRVELIDKPIKVTNIKPGAVNTEFSIVRFKGDTEKANSVYSGFEPLNAEDIADNIEYVLTRKSHVQVATMTILAENQATATMIHRSTK